MTKTRFDKFTFDEKLGLSVALSNYVLYCVDNLKERLIATPFADLTVIGEMASFEMAQKMFVELNKEMGNA